MSSVQLNSNALTLPNKTLQVVSPRNKSDREVTKSRENKGQVTQSNILRSQTIRHNQIEGIIGKHKKSKWGKIFNLSLSKNKVKKSSQSIHQSSKKALQNIGETSTYITSRNEMSGSFSEEDVNDTEEFFFLLPYLEYQKSYEKSVEEIYDEIKKQINESLTQFEDQLNQLNQFRSEFLESKGEYQHINLKSGEHTYPISKMRKIIDQLLDSNTIAHVIFDLEAKNLEQAVTWEKINAPIYVSVLNMLEQNIKEALEEQKKCSTYTNIHILTQSINKMRSNILHVVFSAFELEDYIDFPKCLKRTTANGAGQICFTKSPETLKEAVDCVLNETRDRKVGQVFMVSDEEQLKHLEKKLNGKWGSSLLFERWVQESTRWHWLDIYGRRDYVEKASTLRQFINMKKKQFEKDLDERLSQLWLGCLQEYDLLFSKHISAVAFSTVSLIQDHIRLVSPLSISRYLMEMEDYRSHVLRFLFHSDSTILNVTKDKSHRLSSSKSQMNLRNFLVKKKKNPENYGSVHLEKAASDLTLLKKENREQELLIEQKAKEDEEKSLALEAALNEEKERYENLKNLYTDIVNSIEQRRAEQGKLQVELKSIKKEISALEISVNKKERVNKEEADLLKSFYFKASQDLECFNTKLSKLRDQIFHDQTTVDSATADIITKSNSENVTAEKIRKESSLETPDVVVIKHLPSSSTKTFLSKRLTRVMRFPFHSKKSTKLTS